MFSFVILKTHKDSLIGTCILYSYTDQGLGST